MRNVPMKFHGSLVDVDAQLRTNSNKTHMLMYLLKHELQALETCTCALYLSAIMNWSYKY